MLAIKLFFQLFLNAIIFIFNIVLLRETVNLTTDYYKIKNDLNKFINKEDNIDEDDPNFKPTEFKYISLDGDICSIVEYRNDNLQRYLYYTTENAQDNIPEIPHHDSHVQLNLQENIQKTTQENNELNTQKNSELNEKEDAQLNVQKMLTLNKNDQ